MNVSFTKFLDEQEEYTLSEESRPRAAITEKFRMRRFDNARRRKRPAQFNGIHRRRRRKIT
jgi:hypothetical protein